MEAAVDEYTEWQDEKIGRNINPGQLMRKLMEAGVSRAEITSPVFTDVDTTEVASLGTVSIEFGGYDDG